MMLADYLPHLMLAWGIQLMGIASPGPGVMLILSVATSRGRAPALLTCCGIAAGSIVLSVTTVLGITAIIAQVAEVMLVLKLIGAAYLLWLAYGAFKKAAHPPALTINEHLKLSPTSTAIKGFLMQITNPKAIFFWLAIAAIGGIGTAPLPVVALFIAVAFVNSLLGHSAYALLLSSRPVRAGYMRARRWIEGGLGVFFCFAGFKLATAKV